MKIYQNLAQLESLFDVYLFDAYGVFYDGNKFYPGAQEYMCHLVSGGKQVVILSNSSTTVENAQKSYEKKGLKPGKDYNYLVTSGQVCRETAVKHELPVPGNKFFMIGHKADALEGVNGYFQVNRPEEANFVFIAIPYLTSDEVARLPKSSDYLPARAAPDGSVLYWDSLKVEPFMPLIEKCVKLGLPAINANPDYLAQEKHLDREGTTFVLRNGSIAKYYARAGGNVYQFGKPYANVYDYTFSLLSKNNIHVKPDRTAMIGDTIRTDIKGAVNAAIAPVLCLETGVTAKELKAGSKLHDLLASENLADSNIYLIRSVAENEFFLSPEFGRKRSCDRS